MIARAGMATLAHCDDGVYWHRKVWARARGIGSVPRLIDLCVESRGDGAGDMAASRKSHEADTARIDLIVCCIGAHQPHGALGILEGHIFARHPTFPRKPVAQYKAGDARGIEPTRHAGAFKVQHLANVTTARRHDDGRAIGSIGPEYAHHGMAYLVDIAVYRTNTRIAVLD